LSQVEAKLKEEHAKSAAEKDRLKHDLEREIAHLKLQITESEANCLSFQQKLQQKESKLIEFDQQLKDAKFKLHDTELHMSSLQNKVELKEAKVHELEVSLTHISSNNDKLKQKISENEIQLLNSHSKISEYESKLQRAENNTISLESTISAKDQRIAEYKNQIDAQSDLTNKLEREKKELSRQMEDLTNHNTIVTKELQDIKKKVIDTELELSKTKNSLENLSRDSQREMNFLEEKHKAILSKSHQEKELALSALYSEFNAYKQSSIAEGNRIKCENEESLRNLEKSHQIAIAEVKKKLENSIEEFISLQLKHKGDLTEKTEGLKLEKTNEIEQIRTKYTVMVDMLKGNISDINGKLGDYERAINARDASLKTLEVENVKLSIEKNKLQDEVFALKEKAIKFEEGYYVKLKTLQRDLEEKTETLVKNANTIEELNSQINSLEKSLERNNSILEKEKENYELMSKQAKMLSDKLISLEESRNAQILKLQNDLIDLEREAHEKQIQLEKLEAREAANAETIENLKQSIAQLKDMGEEKSRHSESTKKEMGHVEKKVNELNSILVAKDKVIESLEIAVKNGLSELNLKEEVVSRVTAKLATTEEQLINIQESKTILEFELEKLNHETKRKLDSEKEASRKYLKDTKKKYATSLNELELKLTNEAKILSEKLKVEHETLMNKQQSLNQMKIEGLQKVIDDNAGEIGKLIDEIKTLTQQNEQIQIKYCELRGREDNQLNDLKEKALAITQLKKRLQIAENESVNHCQATQILKAELDSAKCNLITLQSEYQELLLREQRGTLELEYSKKCTTQLELKLSELEQSRESFKALQITYEEQSKCLSKSEHQISNLQKLISRQTKILASVQITLLEISNIVNIQLPWRIEDIMILPERIRASFKSSKAKVPFEMVETNVLLNLVTAVREVTEERQKLIETLDSELRKTKALEQSNSEAKSNLANVSDAISEIELRVQQERREQKEEIENFQTKLQDMESLLDKALGDKTKLEKLCERLKQELNSLSEEKILLEKDYVQVYEKFQSAKVAFVERSKAISADTTAIVEENKRFKLELTAKSNLIKELETLTGDLQNETAKYMEQKKELDKSLNAAKIEISSLSKQFQFQSIEKQQLEKSIKDQEQKYQDEVMWKETEINELYEKYKGAESKIAFLAESLENSQRILQDFKDKWTESIKREKELEKRNIKLFTEIKTYEGRIDEVEKSHNDSAKAHSLALEEKCKLLEAENNTLRTEKMVSDLKLSSRRYTFSKEPLTTERSIPRQLPDPRAEFLNQKQSMPDIKLDFPVKIFPDKIISDDDER
jgi:chromosome segregation ATPase